MLKKVKVVMLQVFDKSDYSPVEIPFLRMNQKDELVKHRAGGEFRKYISIGFEPQHLYFVSDETPKAGDYWIDKDNIVQRTCFDLEYGQKIIATTDKSLRILPEKPNLGSYVSFSLGISLPQPSKEFIDIFIKEYNKSNIITDIMVEYEFVASDLSTKAFHDYHKNNIGIELLKVNPKDNTITIKKIKNNWTKEELPIDIMLNIIGYIDTPVGRMKYHFDVVEQVKLLKTWLEKNI